MLKILTVVSTIFLFYSCNNRKDKYLEMSSKQFVVSASLHVSHEVIDPIEEKWYKFKRGLFQLVYTEGKSLDEVNAFVMKEVRNLDVRIARIMIKVLVCANSSKVKLRSQAAFGWH